MIKFSRSLLASAVCTLFLSSSNLRLETFVQETVNIEPTNTTLPHNIYGTVSGPVRDFCATMQHASKFEKVMLFPLDDIVARCKKDHKYTDEDMALLEKELRRFLYLCITAEKETPVGMYSTDVDNLWHAFILFTREYHAFGNLTQGRYLHHVPTLPDEKPSTPEEYAKARKDFADFITNYEVTFNETINPIWLLDGITEETKKKESS